MDSRAILVGIMLLCLCVSTTYGTISSTQMIVGDKMVDDTDGRKILVDFVITLTTDDVSQQPRVSTSPLISAVSPVVGVDIDIVLSNDCTANPGDDCTQEFTATISSTTFCSSPSPASLEGSFTVTYTHYDAAGATNEGSPQTFGLDLASRELCVDSWDASVNAQIVAYGPFADKAFSHTMDPYHLNDVVYFPFQVTYSNLTISKLTFNTITVASGSSSTTLYESSSNNGVGNLIGLQTTPMTSQLSSGKATVWFSIALSRDEGSPFANTPATATPYTFTVRFDVMYKNAKRALAGEDLAEDGKQLVSQATIRVSNTQGAMQAKGAEARSLSASSAHTLQAGMLSVVSFLFAFFYLF